MRYSDCPTVEVSIEIAAPPARVWALVTDINLPARFSSEFQGAEWLDGAGPAAGSRFHGRQEHPAIGKWETDSEVTVCETERSFGWTVAGGAASWRFDLRSDGDGTTLSQWAQMGPGLSGLNAAIDARPDKEELIVERRLAEWRANMTATVEGIKALAEGGA